MSQKILFKIKLIFLSNPQKVSCIVNYEKFVKKKRKTLEWF